MSKTKNGSILKTLEDADEVLRRMCETESRLEAIDGAADKAIAGIKEKAKKDGEALREQKQTDTKALKAFAQAYREELFKEKKSQELPFGIIGFRKAPDAIAVSADTVELLKKFGYKRFVRTIIEPDKKAMLDLDDKALAQVHAERKSREDFFVETKRDLINQDLNRKRA